MSEINYEFEDEEVYQNQDSQPTNKKKSSSSKKIRRSRIIISDKLETKEESKREIYDKPTKYIKNITSARFFNEYLNISRPQNVKHFLKRKVKAAYEREPIEKGKGFFFNVPFIPQINMFAPIVPSQPQVNINRPIQNANPSIPINKPMPPSQNTQAPPVNMNTQLHINTQHVKSNEISEQTNLPSQKLSNNGSANHGEKPMFNINYGSEKQNPVSNNVTLPNQISLQINNNPDNLNLSENKYQIINNSDLQINNANPIMRNPNIGTTNNISNINNLNNQSSTQMQNYAEYIRRQNIKFKKLYDVYQSDPIRFKREIGSEEFVKFENVLKSKNIPLAKMDVSQSQN